MGGRKRQAYLLKRGEALLRFVGCPSNPSSSSEPTLLFTPLPENLKCFPDQDYNDNLIAAVSQAIEEAAHLDDHEGGKIEMFAKYDTFYDIPRIYTSVTFPEQFVNKLSNLLAEVKISIRGKYQIVQPVHCYRHCLQQQPPSHAHAESFYPNQTPRIVWTPAYDDEGEDFSVEGISLKTQATYANFNGVAKMASSYTSHGMIHAQLKYSVILEWVDFTLDFVGMEQNTFGKLYENKPFHDCIIVDSNNKEFKCHRNILAANSDVLFTALGNGMEESRTNRIVMKDVRGEAVKLLLKFMYAREDLLDDLEGKSEQVVLDLLKASHKYNVSGLELFLCQFLCCKPANWFSIDGALAFYSFTVNVDNLENLTDKFWSLMRVNPQQLLSSAGYKEWMAAKPLEAAQFTAKLLESVVQEQSNPGEVGVDAEERIEEIEIGSDEDEEWDPEDQEEGGDMNDELPQ